jgi:hypothetical protein
MRDIKDKEFNTTEYTIAALTKPLDSIPKE